MLRLSSLALLLSLSGCPSTPTPPTDAGTDAPSSPDVALDDAPVLTVSIAGTPCEADADCELGTCVTEADSGVADGFCSIECTSDMDCPALSHCGGAGFCRPDCPDAGCRTGLVCQDADADGRAECASGGTGTAPLGTPCSGSDECAGGAGATCLHPFSTEGVCTSTCAADADCGAGAHCEGAIGRCFVDCAADTDCIAPAVCAHLGADAVPECVTRSNPTGVPTGGLCATGDVCAARGRRQCITEDAASTWGVCGDRCGDGVSCDAGDHCTAIVQLDGSTLVEACLPDCTTDADCVEGLGCIDVDADGMPECGLAGVGAGEVGDVCANVSECAGGARAACLRALGMGTCTLGCRTSACPTGSVCVTGGGTRVCARSCTVDADCEGGLRCRAATDGMACQP